MTEATGYEARTIHRMLELVPVGMSGNDAPVIPGAPRSGREPRAWGCILTEMRRILWMPMSSL